MTTITDKDLFKQRDFSKEIEDIVWDKNISYIDAICVWCDINNIEIDVAAYLIKKDQVMKDLIEKEARTLNVLKKLDPLI